MNLSDWKNLLPLIGTLLTILGSILAWAVNQRANRQAKNRERQEERYQLLLDSLRGFYIDTIDKNLKSEFLRQLNLAWMYCPDDVIKCAYEFLESVHTQNKKSDTEKELAVGRLVVAIRNDMARNMPLAKSKLTAKDFKHLKAT